jgi:hypothetical protein
MKSRRPSHAVIVAYLALVLALSGTGYAAAKIDGRTLKNGSVTGKKLAPDTLTGRQVVEGSLGPVPRARAADDAEHAEDAEHAGTAGNADNANTLGSLEPNAFARSSQFLTAGPFTTNPSGPDQEFFWFPEIDLRIVTPREPNAPGSAGLIEIQHGNPDIPLWATYETAGFSGGGQFGETSSGINFPVNGPSSSDDFLRMTFHSPTTGVVVHLECVANALVTDIPVMCSALKFSP